MAAGSESLLHPIVMKTHSLVMLLIVLLGFTACKEEEPDTEKPVISLGFTGASPQNCDTLYLGDTLKLRMLFTDNAELGSFSFDIHPNFDHHAHSTEVTSCTMDPDKTPVNPLVMIRSFSIPAGQTSYTTDISVVLPGENSNGLYDTGDYHFFLSLTDKEGWSAQKGLSIKVLRR